MSILFEKIFEKFSTGLTGVDLRYEKIVEKKVENNNNNNIGRKGREEKRR